MDCEDDECRDVCSQVLRRPVTPCGFPPPGLLTLERLQTEDVFDRPQILPDLGVKPCAVVPEAEVAIPHPDLMFPPPPGLLDLERFETEDVFERPQVLGAFGLGFPALSPNEPMSVPLPDMVPPPPSMPAPTIEAPLLEPPPCFLAQDEPPPPPSLPPPALPSESPVPVPAPDHAPTTDCSQRPRATQPSTLTSSAGADGASLFHWSMDGRKLESLDKQAVSPEFTVDFPQLGLKAFKLVIYPCAVNHQRRGAGFKKSKGRGRIQLKCIEEDLPSSMPDVTLSLQVGGGSGWQPMRGPIIHNFYDHSCGNLPVDEEEWNFGVSVDESGTFTVLLQLAIATTEQGRAH